jgi:hypothetical protein
MRKLLNKQSTLIRIRRKIYFYNRTPDLNICYVETLLKKASFYFKIPTKFPEKLNRLILRL